MTTDKTAGDAYTNPPEPPPDPGQDQDPKRPPSSLADMAKLENVDERGWLDPNNPPPPMPRLLTAKDARGEDACFLPLGRTAMLVAPGGVGKTQALMQLAVAVATGRPWLDTYDVASPGPVLAIFGEEDADEFKRRLHRCATALDLWGDKDAMGDLGRNLHALPMYGKPVTLVDKDGKETAFTEDLRRLLAGKDWRLVILDPASRFMGPECETDNKAATTWIECLERITQAHGKPAVLFAHHTNKGGLNPGETDQGAARGSSALTDGVRWQANLDRAFDTVGEGRDAHEKLDPNRCTLRVVKRNYGPPTNPLELERDIDHGGYLVPVSAATLKEATLTSNKRIAAEKRKLPGLESDMKTKRKQLADFEATTTQGTLDKKEHNRVDNERAKLGREVRDAERALEAAQNRIEHLSGRPVVDDGGEDVPRR